MTMNRVIGVAATAGCAALVIAGCGTVHAPSRSASARASASASPASASPEQRASADAASILSSFVPPPGAVRTTAVPGNLRVQPFPIRGANSVHDTSYWHVSGSPQSALAWEKAHLPSRFSAVGSGTTGSPATLWDENFALPAAQGVLTERGLAVAAVKTGGGQATLRVDAQVTWAPAKPAAERIPAAAKVVTVSPAPALVAGARMPSTVTITNAATVQRIASLIDGLPVFPPGSYSCPAGLDRSVEMTFKATPGGSPLAVVTAAVTGCQGVRVIIGGHTQPMLAGGADTARQVLSIAGTHWSGYGGANHLPGDVNPGGPMQH